MIINKREEQGVIILEPDGRLDSNTSPVLELEISHIDSGSDGYHLLVDFLNIDYISSAGLRVILKAFKERQEGPKYFAVSGMQDHVREVFEISGFPGEAEEDFQDTMKLLEIVKYNGSFSFKYSDRPGTKAQQLGSKVPEHQKSARLQVFQKRQDEISLEKNRAYVGKTVKILVEKVTKENVVGRTETNHIVHIDLAGQKHTVIPGDYRDVVISFAGQHSLKGNLLIDK